MIIKSVDLNNFRNYKDLSVEFDKGTNILYGNNAQGKTNLLEALYMSGTSKSYKGAKDREMINFDEEIKKFKPSLDVDDAEAAIYGQDLTDVIDILKEMMEDTADKRRADKT